MANNQSDESRVIAEDIKTLHGMGYAQELARSMKSFSNFAISFSIICILSGGINSLGQAISGAGGAAIGIGWPVGCLISFVFALGLAQISSAYPTAGGLYHWGSILGNVGVGWVTAWLNLIGLVTVLGAINIGTYSFFIGAFGPSLGIADTFATKMIFMVIITASQAMFNHLGIRLTTKLTDLSGYLIIGGAALMFVLFMAYAKAWDFSRLWTFTNYSGLPEAGAVWPKTESLMFVFLLGLLLPIYTITGYDASAHTSEETVDASRSVPKGMVSSVIWSAIFGWLMLCAFVLAIPDMGEGAKQGWNIFFWTSDQVLPQTWKMILYVVVVVSQYLCGLATVTSASTHDFCVLPRRWIARLCGIAQRQPEIPYTGRRDLGVGRVGCALYQLCRVVRGDCFGDGHFPILVVYGTDLLRFTGPRQNLDQDGPVGYGAEIQNRCGTLRRRHDLDLSHWCATAR